jgi:integrase
MKGIRRDRYGWRAYVKVGTLQREKRFKADTLTKTMQNWRDETRVALRKLARAPVRGTLAEDIRTYLAKPTIKSLGSYKSRVCEVEAWVPLYGPMARALLTRDHILAAREAWLADEFAPKTINHRVRALRHLFHTLDGSTSTPCDGVKKLAEPKAQPVAVAPAIFRKVLKKLTDPATRARFMVLAATGQRPAQLMRAVRTDVDLRRRIWFVRSAKGGEPIPLPLTDDMLAAWREFITAKAFGPYDTSTHAKRLYEAGWPKDVRPYNAKHTVGILLAQSGADYEDIRDFFGHRDVKTTRIYTGFVASRLRKTSGLLAGRLGWHTRKQA